MDIERRCTNQTCRVRVYASRVGTGAVVTDLQCPVCKWVGDPVAVEDAS